MRFELGEQVLEIAPLRVEAVPVKDIAAGDVILVGGRAQYAVLVGSISSPESIKVGSGREENDPLDDIVLDADGFAVKVTELRLSGLAEEAPLNPDGVEPEKAEPRVFATFPELLYDAPDGEYVSCKYDGSSLGELDTLRFRKAGTVWLRYKPARSAWEMVSVYAMAALTSHVRKDS